MNQRYKPKRILLADDDTDDCLLIEDAFKECELVNDFHVVHDGEELLDYLLRRDKYVDPSTSPRPELILLDLNMPRMDGREALKQIRKDSKLRRIPVIVLTTSQAEEDILQSYDAGANSFISKPGSYEGLVEAMQTLSTFWFQIVKLPDTLV